MEIPCPQPPLFVFLLFVFLPSADQSDTNSHTVVEMDENELDTNVNKHWAILDKNHTEGVEDLEFPGMSKK